MNKILLIYLLLLFGLFQAQQSSNRFEEAEIQEMSTQATMEGADEGGQVPGGDDPLPVPIDGYISLLGIIAVGLIIFNHKRYRQFLQTTGF